MTQAQPDPHHADPHHADPHHATPHHAGKAPAPASKGKLALLVLVGVAAIVLIAYAIGVFMLGLGHSSSQQYQTRGKLEAVCDVVVQRPVDGLNQPFEISKLALPVVIDFDEMTGAYAGEYSISLNRKGSLHVDGDKVEILRQAMFRRYGLTIQGEHAELNRKTGEFNQWLDLGNDKHLTLMSGKCHRPGNAPF